MKIFISWSGNRSRRVAELIDDWISCVLQASDPWVSTRDIDRGALWFTEIADQLANTNSGIICLTQENKNRPWVLFEAGALAKGLSTNRVCTLLVDLVPNDLQDPLAQFNHTMPDNRSSMRALVGTLNARLGENQIEERLLDRIFDTYWSQFEEGFAKILAETENQPSPPPRTDAELLNEILSGVRGLNQRVRKLESGVTAEREQTSLTSGIVTLKNGRRIITPLNDLTSLELGDAELPDIQRVKYTKKDLDRALALAREAARVKAASTDPDTE
jgi:hypothetical protein